MKLSSCELTCASYSVYFIEIRPKRDFKGSLEDISEFYYSIRMNNDPDFIRICVVGAHLHDMISDIYLSVGQSAYISSITIGSEIAVFDYYNPSNK